MGRMYAEGLADTVLSMEQQISIHLRANHYPPVPSSMVQPCIDAIEAYNTGEPNKLIGLPAGVQFRGSDSAPVIALIEQFHLETWVDDEGW